MADTHGKSPLDWETAFAYYASLPSRERTYATVATHFGVSPRTVETHGRTEHWKERLREIQKEAAARTADALIDARVEEITRMRRLIDGSLINYAERLREGMRMTPADLERLNRLSVQLIDEATNPRPDTTVREPDQPERTPEHAAAVLAALEETGALEALGLTRIQPDPPETAADTDDSPEDDAATDAVEENDPERSEEPTPTPPEEEDRS